jgi:pyruvate/2-oxoglutarate dehydrogenase complex dihydrolipoamide acyltransferase (E2) component
MRFNPDEYITVSERIEKFYTRFPQGRIVTTIIEHSAETGFILMRTEVYREPDDALPAATGHAYELRSAGHVQAGSYVEVCETSSVGRALALLGFEVRRGVASREEVIRGAKKQQAATAAATPAPPAAPPAPAAAPERAARPEPRAAAPEQAAGATPAARVASESAAGATPDLDEQILRAAEELGYDAAKVRKWVNQKFEVTGGLGSLTPHDKREVLKIFTEQARSPSSRTARK